MVILTVPHWLPYAIGFAFLLLLLCILGMLYLAERRDP